MNKTNKTIMVFYNGAYGPTIRINVQDSSWLKLLKDSIIQLKKKSITELDLLKLYDVDKEGLSQFKLISGQDSSLSLISQSGNCAAFLWTITMENIIYMISAIDRLLKENTPGHYYFYDDDGYLIELAYKE